MEEGGISDLEEEEEVEEVGDQTSLGETGVVPRLEIEAIGENETIEEIARGKRVVIALPYLSAPQRPLANNRRRPPTRTLSSRTISSSRAAMTAFPPPTDPVPLPLRKKTVMRPTNRPRTKIPVLRFVDF